MDDDPTSLRSIEIQNNCFKPQLVLNQKSKNANIYYGIFVSDTVKIHKDMKLVFTDKAECLTILKTMQGARFKSFSSEAEALKFVECGPILTYSTPDTHKDEKNCILVGEKPSPFRGPKSQDLVKFRKAIEKGNIDYFEECVNLNPRYLVSCGDTPSILQEGSRYNALHIACRYNQTNLCQRILSTVSKEDFFQKLYPDDSIESSKRRSQFLLDLYLNTPDKGFNETPLHFSCKYGSVGCVKVLVSYIACDKNRTNKYQEKPVEMICSRVANQNKAVIQQIEDLLGDLYYIPVLRDEDNCLPPQIGAPCSINESINLNSNLIGSPTCSSSPVSPSLKVRGYAGPMSPQKAESFHCKWKHALVPSPFKNMQGKPDCIRIADHEKGLERIGRELASEFRVDWHEYWDFLGSFTKLPSEDGLKKLEKHLQNLYKNIIMERNFEDLSDSVISFEEKFKENKELDLTDSFCQTDSSFNCLDVTQFSSTSIGEICRGLEALRLNMSLSPNPKTGTSFISFNSNPLLEENLSTPYNKFSNKSYLEEDVLNHSNLDSSLSFSKFYNFIIQSISITSERLLTILTEAADRLELHVGPNFNVTLHLKAKIKKEIGHLRQAIVSHFLSQPNCEKYDLSFIHILLAANVSILLPENVTGDKIHLLLQTIIDMRKNIEFFEGSSSEGEETFCDTICDLNSTFEELQCVVKAFEQSLTIINSLTKTREECKLNESDLGSCKCVWDPVGGGTLKLPNYEKMLLNSSTESKRSHKYSHAHSFLSKVLFSETPSKNISKRLIFNDDEYLNQSYIASITEDDSEQDEDDAESFISAASSVDDAGMVTPEEAINVYINGAEPSKVDVDVLLALDGTEIDPEKYPYTHMWHNLVSSKPSQVRDSWDSPCCRRRLPSSSCNALANENLTLKRPRNIQFDNLGQSPKL